MDGVYKSLICLFILYAYLIATWFIETKYDITNSITMEIHNIRDFVTVVSAFIIGMLQFY